MWEVRVTGHGKLDYPANVPHVAVHRSLVPCEWTDVTLFGQGIEEGLFTFQAFRISLFILFIQSAPVRFESVIHSLFRLDDKRFSPVVAPSA